MTRAVGVVGLGAMGGRMAEVLLESYPVVVHDLDPDRRRALAGAGATAVDSPREVAERASVVLLSLPEDAALEAVVEGDGGDGLAAGLGPDDVVVDTSTVSPAASEAAAAACADRGAGFLDAPVSGGARNADTGDLTALVGGEASTLDRVRGVLDAVAAEVHHVGPQGTGAALKVVNNYLFACNQLVLCEGLMMARALGVPDGTFVETVSDSSGGSYALDRNMERFVLPDDYDSEFTLALMRKDATLAERLAREHDVPLLVGGVSDLYRLGERLGYGDLDSSAALKLYETLVDG